MDIQQNSDENVAHEITRRKVAQASLKKIRAIVSGWEEDERQRVALVKGAYWILPTAYIVLILAFILFLTLFFAHPKFQLFAGSILLGIFGGIALIAWNQRHRK